MIYAVRDSAAGNARVMVKGDPKVLGPEVHEASFRFSAVRKFPPITKEAVGIYWPIGSLIRRTR